MKRIAFFCGAGAEISYGLPSGGKFALDLFRMDNSVDKGRFKERRDKINSRSAYASCWLPLHYRNKNVSAFARGSYETLLKGSLENKGGRVLQYAGEFDRRADRLAASFAKKGIDIRQIFEAFMNHRIGEENYAQSIELTKELYEGNVLFSSSWFSAFLTLYQAEGIPDKLRRSVRNFIRSLIQLVIGVSGERLTRRLNDETFTINSSGIDIFDDLGGLFSLDYRNAGVQALEYVIGYGEIRPERDKSREALIEDFGAALLEELLAEILDYQELIDTNWRYLYSPKNDWAKFCKISIFLYTAKRYISEAAGAHEERCRLGPGFYHDILSLEKDFEITAVGTSNYNSFIEDILGKGRVYFLNGRVGDMYDPFTNSITDMTYEEHLTVPFLFTQSGIKPMTSIEMSRRYVDMYDAFKTADHIFVIGFGFNSDDGHINGLFRSLIIDEGRQIHILHYAKGGEDEASVLREYRTKLRLEQADGIHIQFINGERQIFGRFLWSEYVRKHFR